MSKVTIIFQGHCPECDAPIHFEASTPKVSERLKSALKGFADGWRSPQPSRHQAKPPHYEFVPVQGRTPAPLPRNGSLRDSALTIPDDIPF